MADLETPELEILGPTYSPTLVELGALRVLYRVPGFRGLVPSARMVTAMRGGLWTMVGYGISQFLKLASTLILARMLVPQAFGAVALVNVFLSGLEMLSDLGIGMDVVQHPNGDDPAFINTAFIIQAGRGITLWILATVLAYPFVRFYHQPEVLMLLIVGSLSVLFRGFTSGSIWGLTRHVRLGKYNAMVAGTDFFAYCMGACGREGWERRCPCVRQPCNCRASCDDQVGYPGCQGHLCFRVRDLALDCDVFLGRRIGATGRS
jgi:hypothetical protein